jgi:ribonuclease P protein component
LLEATISILPTLKARAEFLAVRGGRRSSTPAFLIEMRERPTTGTGAIGPRFGFTITKKIGNAVTRNRIRRRLKAAFAAAARAYAQPSCDYVIVARQAALDRPFALLLEDVGRALSALHGNRKSAATAKPLRGPPLDGNKKGSA